MRKIANEFITRTEGQLKKSKIPNPNETHPDTEDRLSIFRDTEDNGSSANLTIDPLTSLVMPITKQVELCDLAEEFLTRPEEECSLPLYDEDGLVSREELQWLSKWYIKDFDRARVRSRKISKTLNLIEPYPSLKELAKRLSLYTYTIDTIDLTSSISRGKNKLKKLDPNEPHPCRGALAARLAFYPDCAVSERGESSSSAANLTVESLTTQTVERKRIRALVKTFRMRPESQWRLPLLDEKGLSIPKEDLARHCIWYIVELEGCITRNRRRKAELK
jgi:hypothetical protein